MISIPRKSLSEITCGYCNGCCREISAPKKSDEITHLFIFNSSDLEGKIINGKYTEAMIKRYGSAKIIDEIMDCDNTHQVLLTLIENNSSFLDNLKWDIVKYIVNNTPSLKGKINLNEYNWHAIENYTDQIIAADVYDFLSIVPCYVVCMNCYKRCCIPRDSKTQ